jgi:hypothetical protein
MFFVFPIPIFVTSLTSEKLFAVVIQLLKLQTNQRRAFWVKRKTLFGRAHVERKKSDKLDDLNKKSSKHLIFFFFFLKII